MRTVHQVLLLVARFAPVDAYQIYQEYVPNGFNVPGAPGLGHVAHAGEGPRNVFGKIATRAGESPV
jgi:hypothetical protein